MLTASKSKRDFRNLANITETASTSRILNLAHVHSQSGNDPDYGAKPFFKNGKLNKAVLIKHTLRPNELELFQKPRRSATKIIMPFDPNDLRLGGEAFFINQLGYDRSIRALLSASDGQGQTDLETLAVLDTLPSLDPFLLRESLARKGIQPAACYLRISANDISSMITFANTEIERLINIAYQDGAKAASMRFTGKILSDSLDKELEPLKATLRLSPSQFADGIFSWRGFLYFKWRHLDLQSELRAVIDGLAKYQPIGLIDTEVKEFLTTVRPRLAKRILTALGNVGNILHHYDASYSALIDGHDPGPFRQFLLDGPKMFFELGEHVGILTHIASFWSYRMSGGLSRRLTPLDYADTLLDFDESLACVFIGE